MVRTSRRAFAIGLSSLLGLASAIAGVARAAPPPARAFEVDANVGLAAFVAIADGHLQKMTDSLRVLALSEEARAASWAKIERPLGEVAKLNAAALNWFALPDGSYWSVQNGKEQGNLSSRAYFPKLLAGKTVIGDLVVSKATSKSVAIVAVPVKGRDGSVVGVLGASVYLKPLSDHIREEMKLGADLIFFSFDASPRLALVWDESLIFTNPRDLGPEVDQAFAKMLQKDHGVIRYSFRGTPRTVVFSKSAVTGWRYGLGLVGPTKSASAAEPGAPGR